MERALKEKLERAIREYAERMWEKCKSRKSVGDDIFIDCPCSHRGGHRSIRFKNREWRCSFFDCLFVIPEEFAPPSPEEIEEIYRFKQLKEREEKLDKILKIK